MVLIPLVMNKLEQRGTLKRIPWANAPIQIGLLGIILTFATPMCCALFKQQVITNANQSNLLRNLQLMCCALFMLEFKAASDVAYFFLFLLQLCPIVVTGLKEI